MEGTLILVFTALGVNHLYVFLYKREWFDDKNKLLGIVIFYIFLFLTATLLNHAELPLKAGEYERNDFFLILKMPLLSIAMYKAMQYAFIKSFGYSPRDSFWTNNLKLMKDGVFNFIFWVFGMLVPVILIFGKFI